MDKFPEGFIFGTACASFQCEGAYNEDGKGESIWDEFCRIPGKVKNSDDGKTACDSYHRAAEDVRLMKEMGIKVHRFSMSWPRIFPQGRGNINPLGFKYYDELVDTLIENGIEPWITLYHWDLPLALQKEGGWLNKSTIDAFVDYAKAVAKHFDGRVKVYMPINEPECIAVLGYGTGEHAPGWQLEGVYVAQVMHNLCLAFSRASKAIREASSEKVQIGTVTTGRLCFPRCPNPTAEEKCYLSSFDLSSEITNAWGFTHSIYLDPLFFKKYDDSANEMLKEFAKTVPQGEWDEMVKPDFVGLNVYNGTMCDDEGRAMKLPTGFPRTAIGWPVTPEVMYYGTRHLYKRYGTPIIICENGVACNDRLYEDGLVHDADRIDFLSRYLGELRRSIASGTDIRGYLQWSVLDNFEWAEGYDPRFGLIYVDYETCERTPKDSARWYGKLIKENSEQHFKVINKIKSSLSSINLPL